MFDFNFAKKEYVYAVYTEKSFSKAAKKLFVSQPALSSSIKKLEDSLGEPIFDRSTNPISLTECGKHYIKATERIFEIEKGFSEYVDALNTNTRGVVRIGGSSVFVSFLLPVIIRKFQKNYPYIQIELIQRSTHLLEDDLISGTIDAVIEYNSFDNSIFEKNQFNSETLLLVVPTFYPENEQLIRCQLSIKDIHEEKYHDSSIPAIEVATFIDYPFIVLSSENESRTRMDSLFASENVLPASTICVEQQQTAYQMACAGCGVCLVSDVIIKNLQASEKIVFYKINNKYSHLNQYLYTKQNRRLTNAMRLFCETCLLQKGE